MREDVKDPNDLRAYVVNWGKVAGDLIRHLHEVITTVPSDTIARALLEEALRYPGVPQHWQTRDLSSTPTPVLTVEFKKNDTSLRFFSNISTFGTSRDVTVDELRIECTFPADDATAAFCKQLASKDF